MTFSRLMFYSSPQPTHFLFCSSCSIANFSLRGENHGWTVVIGAGRSAHHTAVGLRTLLCYNLFALLSLIVITSLGPLFSTLIITFRCGGCCCCCLARRHYHNRPFPWDRSSSWSGQIAQKSSFRWKVLFLVGCTFLTGSSPGFPLLKI